ncbi:hypothetical protein DKK70_09890 [Gilliamella apicola]|uniref:Uncharacterized protein n=1 Tax=Gilliamella apicola TaxID=1196095 RepID=A0A2V4DZF7_9GAMM|nr:hypothetical protein [Gilliamella apicola]PXZ06290.1 hypothetical protein DKK70_09890 [Gilliamella apicola]
MKYFKGNVIFKYSEKDIIKVGNILSKLIFDKEEMFYGLDNYLRDEVPFIYTDNILGFYFGIMQNPEQLDLFSLEINDVLSKGNDQHIIDITDRLKFVIEQFPKFEIIKG